MERSLAGYSSWGCKELDTTERLSNHKADASAACFFFTQKGKTSSGIALSLKKKKKDLEES